MLFLYYLFLFIASLICIIVLLFLYEVLLSKTSKMVGMVLFSIPSALLGSSIYYIRKLYKACIQNIIEEPSEDFSSKIRTLGTQMYFYIRPLISIALSIILILGIYIGINILTVDPEITEENFYILCAIMSFYLGFSNGLILREMDNKDNKLLNSILGGKNNGT